MSKQTFTTLYGLVKQDANYVPRNFQTIGGAWTRDTWRLGDVKAFLEDEGYTQGIQFFQEEKLVLNVTTTYGRELVFYEGDEALLEQALLTIR